MAKKLQIPYEYTLAIEEVYGEEWKAKPTQKAINKLKPGDLAIFNYKGEGKLRKFLIVSTPKAMDGKFVSSRKNKLICGYDLNGKETISGLVMVFNSFYKKDPSDENKNRSSRRIPRYTSMKKTMKSVFGDSYRTFDEKLISDFYEIQVTRR